LIRYTWSTYTIIPLTFTNFINLRWHIQNRNIWNSVMMKLKVLKIKPKKRSHKGLRKLSLNNGLNRTQRMGSLIRCSRGICFCKRDDLRMCDDISINLCRLEKFLFYRSHKKNIPITHLTEELKALAHVNWIAEISPEDCFSN